MTYPKISIVTPSFNQGKYLEDTILSVLNQNYPNLEYIIIDGGSTDNSVEIIKKYEKHLSYWVSERDSGMYHAIQKGFERSTGEVMAYLNSDDLYYSKSFFVVAEIFSRFEQVQWIQGLPSEFDDQGRITYVGPVRRWSKYNFFLGEYEWIRQESCFWRKSLWEKAGSKMDTGLKYAGDFELWQRFFDHAELYCLRTVLGGFRARNENQYSVERMGDYKAEAGKVHTQRVSRLSPEEKKVLEKLQLYISVYRKIPGFRTRMYGRHVKNYGYPPLITFDREAQRFRME